MRVVGDSLTNPGLMQAKQNVWNASGQQPMVSAAAGAGNAMNSLSLVSPPNVNIGSASALPPNINIQNIGGLQGLGLVNLQVGYYNYITYIISLMLHNTPLTAIH